MLLQSILIIITTIFDFIFAKKTKKTKKKKSKTVKKKVSKPKKKKVNKVKKVKATSKKKKKTSAKKKSYPKTAEQALDMVRVKLRGGGTTRFLTEEELYALGVVEMPEDYENKTNWMFENKNLTQEDLVKIVYGSNSTEVFQ